MCHSVSGSRLERCPYRFLKPETEVVFHLSEGSEGSEGSEELSEGHPKRSEVRLKLSPVPTLSLPGDHQDGGSVCFEIIIRIEREYQSSLTVN